jgi:serine/threonine protein kinase
LYDFIENQKKESKNYTDESLLLKWLQQCASALEHVHNRQMIHRDIKPANLFLTIDNDVKIGDFGLTLSTVGKKSIQLTRDSGSIFYNSPETVDDTKYSHKTDIWSVLEVYIFILN